MTTAYVAAVTGKQDFYECVTEGSIGVRKKGRSDETLEFTMATATSMITHGRHCIGQQIMCMRNKKINDITTIYNQRTLFNATFGNYTSE